MLTLALTTAVAAAPATVTGLRPLFLPAGTARPWLQDISPPGRRGRASSQADHVARRRPFDEVDHVPRHGRHDPLVLIGIAVAVVDVRHLAGLVIGHPVHRIAAEAKSGDPRQATSPQVEFEDFRKPPFHPKWKEISLSAPLHGWKRFPAAQTWLDQHSNMSSDMLRKFDQFMATRVSEPGKSAATAPEQNAELFEQFLKWQKTSAAKPAAPSRINAQRQTTGTTTAGSAR